MRQQTGLGNTGAGAAVTSGATTMWTAPPRKGGVSFGADVAKDSPSKRLVRQQTGLGQPPAPEPTVTFNSRTKDSPSTRLVRQQTGLGKTAQVCPVVSWCAPRNPATDAASAGGGAAG